ncbi:MAG: sugar ABC transporter permease [Anaerolineae bacterium]
MAKKSSGMSELAKREERLAYWLLLPTILVIILIAVYPLTSVFLNSFTNSQFASSAQVEVVGLNNYKQLLGITIVPLPPMTDPATGQPVVDPATGEVVYMEPFDVLPTSPTRYREVLTLCLGSSCWVLGATDPAFIRSVRDTIVFTFSSVVLELLLGLGVALVLNGFGAKSITRVVLLAIMLIPWAIPTAVSSRIWQYMFGPTRTGFFNTLFWHLGIGDGNIPFLTSPNFQIPAMVIIDVWKTTSFMALLLLAGLQLIPKDIYEASDVDGASAWTKFTKLTMPLLRTTIAVALVFRTLDALRVFDLFQIVLAQSRYSMASFTYYQLINNRAMGYSSASSMIIFLIILVFAVGYIRMVGVEEK